MEDWNLLNAVTVVDWNKYINKNSMVLDLGGGTGWLSSYLSKIENIDNIFLLDSSEYSLTTIFPEVARLMDAKTDKITPIQGLFSPILLEDGSVDIVVACSSLHHTDNLENLLREVHRVLKKDGVLFILNETPRNHAMYILLILRQFLLIMKDTLFRKYMAVSPFVSSSGYFTDPYLSDKAYPLWYWQKAINASCFRLRKIIRTPYLTQKKDINGVRLTHFICEKTSA